jgi:hypothetical protein
LNGSGAQAFTAPEGKKGAIDCPRRKFASDCATYPN